MKTKLLMLTTVLFLFLTVSCKSDATKCVDNLIDEIENARTNEELERKTDTFLDFVHLYDPGFSDEEEYREYFHDVVDEMDVRYDEIVDAMKDNKNLDLEIPSKEERKESIRRLHKRIDKAEIKVKSNGNIEIKEVYTE